MASNAVRPLVYQPPRGPVDIIYQDESFLIVDKPAGLLSVPGKAENHKDCLESRIHAEIPAARIVHRLDMATSGVMVMALTPEAHRHLGLQFERRHTAKTYIARVWGDMQDESGDIDLPLICDWPNRPLQMVDYESGKPAQTAWEVTARTDIYTQLRLTPKTGRSHQLRVHMNELGHPILGDGLYAHEDAYTAAPRLMLHAHTLSFRHPNGGAHVIFKVRCPF